MSMKNITPYKLKSKLNTRVKKALAMERQKGNKLRMYKATPG